MPTSFFRSAKFPPLAAVAAGLTYALLLRFAYGGQFGGEGDDLLSLAFLVGGPLGLGALTAYVAGPARSAAHRIFVAPLLAVALFLVAAFVFMLEGLICLILILPLFFLLSMAGAALYVLAEKLLRRRDANRPRHTLAVAALAAAPLLATPLEHRWARPDELRRVENAVDIDAPAAAVWAQIVRVPAIRPADLPPSLTDAIGFPRPVEATLTREGVGGVRHATFERGVEFVETVDDWQPRRRLSFAIKPNTKTIPPTTFDEHVAVGGRYFDVLRGTYELRPLSPTRTRLVLYSEQRLSTHVNSYAGFWTDWVMSEIQSRILQVVRRRSERSTHLPPAGPG